MSKKEKGKRGAGREDGGAHEPQRVGNISPNCNTTPSQKKT